MFYTRLLAALSTCLMFGALVLLPVHAQRIQDTQTIPQPKLPTKPLTIGSHRIVAEIADNDPTRQRGMMMRTAMGTNEGMLFIFDEPRLVCMWMRNTLIPLSVAFLDEQANILNIEDMKPQSDESHCSVKNAKYALEMNQGWFKKRSIKAGRKIDGILPAAKPAASK